MKTIQVSDDAAKIIENVADGLFECSVSDAVDKLLDYVAQNHSGVKSIYDLVKKTAVKEKYSELSKRAKIAEGWKMSDPADTVTVEIVDGYTGEVLDSWKTNRPSYYIDRARRQYLVTEIARDVNNNITLYILS